MSEVITDTNSFSAEFLDDYFAECEEHLALVRRKLLELEEAVGPVPIRPSLLEDLLRSFHTLKGISGMVGLEEAEQLAHEMESYLRALRQAQVVLTVEGISGLIAGTKMLEQVITALRANQPRPDIGSVVNQLTALTPLPATSAKSIASAPSAEQSQGLNAEQEEQLQAALQNGAAVWRFCFTPSAELLQQGINVNTVRARLLDLGDVIRAVPLVRPQSGIVFEFIVASQRSVEELSALTIDGLSFTPHNVPAPSAFQPMLATASAQDESPPITRAALPTVAPANVVRVELARLDELMRMVGDLVISRSRLKNQLDRAEKSLPAAQWRDLQETGLAIERQLRDLRECVMRTRMVPVGEVFERMRFVVRDLARASEKKIHIEISGQETELDKFLVERLMDPLLHLVRNAVAHGLETSEERTAQGKSPESKLSLRAMTRGENVILEIEDDGRGIDVPRVAERARSLGKTVLTDALNEEQLLDLLCIPGFSTREEADRASGRGVGMDVVRKAVQHLNGLLTMETTPRQGTCFRLQLPLTLLITDALIVTAGAQTFAVPQAAVQEVIEVQAEAVKVLEKNEIIHYRGAALPLLHLTRLFALPVKPSPIQYAVVVGSNNYVNGLVVDRLLGLQEIVVRAMSDPLLQVPGIAGVTELGDGRPVLILDPVSLVRQRSLKLKGAVA